MGFRSPLEVLEPQAGANVGSSVGTGDDGRFQPSGYTFHQARRLGEDEERVLDLVGVAR